MTSSEGEPIEAQTSVESAGGDGAVGLPGELSPAGLQPLDPQLTLPAGGEGERDALPDRYEVRDKNGDRFIRCEEAPGVAVTIDSNCSFTEAEARRLGRRVILLDGVGKFGPLLDNEEQLYNIDHHQGCYRSLTLAACEQSLVLVVKGLELDRGRWRIYANEPDLDTVFSIWVLLNYRRVPGMRPEGRDILLPLLRLEGAIDANGFAAAEFCGLTRASLARAREALDGLQAHELELKRSGEWEAHDPIEYTRRALLEIDRLVYRRSDFADYSRIEEEYEHVEIGADKVAVVCRDSSGIYEVENRLKKVWGDRLAIVALEKGDRQFTLRRTASFSGFDLRRAYYRLNLLDPVVDGRPPEKEWGGSDDIGGSPRPDGTGLAPGDIARILRNSYRRPGRFERLIHVVGAGLWTVLVSVLVGLAVAVRRFQAGSMGGSGAPGVELGIAALLMLAVGWMLIRRCSHRKSWLFGWRRPAGHDWIWLVPAILAGAALGGAWLPPHAPVSVSAILGVIGGAACAALGLEVWFRGFVHGIQVLDAPVQRIGGRWFVSQAALISGLAYAVVTWAVSGFLIAGSPLWTPIVGAHFWVLFGAFLSGVALCGIRERSLSLWPGAAAQLLGALSLLALRTLL